VRRLGLLLLLVGFGWLSLQQINIVLRADLRAVGEAQHAKLSQDPNHRYSGQEVRDHIRETALAVNSRFPSFWRRAPLCSQAVFCSLLLASGRQGRMPPNSSFKPTLLRNAA
jgi:hypothetical protein